MDRLLERFWEYIAINSQSKTYTKSKPSSSGQVKLAQLLLSELSELGISTSELLENGCVMAKLPANIERSVPAIGFISHLDTSPDFVGKNVKPQLIENYRGGDIALGIGNSVLSPVTFPILHEMIGKTIITTDGKTLLGAENKAGIAEIMTAISHLEQQNIPHGDIYIVFTPDAKIGRGAHNIDLKKFKVQWAYNLIGRGIGGLEYENFNIANVRIKIIGKGTLKESSKEGMVNALTLATRIHNQIPSQEIAKSTIMDQGFYHLNGIKGTVEKTEMNYIICDFDEQSFAKRKRAMFHIAEELGKDLHPDCYIELTVDDICYNMNKVVCQYPHVIDIAKQAMIDCNIKPIVQPIRDITHGALLANYGIPCPNIFTGGYNFDSKYEFISLEGMQQAVEVILRIVTLTAQYAKSDQVAVNE